MGKVLHASGSGYFQFCIGPITDQSIQVPLVDAMDWWWRIKSYRASAPASTVTVRDNESFDQPIYVTSFPQIDSIFVPRPSTTLEEEIVCNPPKDDLSFQFNGTQTKDIPPMSYPVGIVIQHFVSFLGSGFGIEGNITQPPYTCGLLRSTSMGGEYVISAGSTHAICGTLTIKTTKSLVQTFNILFQLPETTLISGSINILIEPYEYWSYGGTYNTSTGDPL
jgi:hypothetical protein